MSARPVISGDLIVRHPGADDAPRHVHATYPFIVEDLIAAGDDGIHRGVFGPRHVPEQPDEGSRGPSPGSIRIWSSLELIEDALNRENVTAHVARVHRGVLSQEECHQIHADLRLSFTIANGQVRKVRAR